MNSEIFDDKSMVFLNQKEFGECEDNDEDLEKTNYFNDIKKEFIYLQKKLENWLSMYNSEKRIDCTQKRELEHLENLIWNIKNLK